MPDLSDLKLYQMDRVDRAINDYAALDNPTLADLNKVCVIAEIEAELDTYRIDSLDMTRDEVEAEAHDSARLGRQMEAASDPRPHEFCDAHAIVAGAHKEAAALRAVLAWFKLRIDDPYNGCWLPRNTKALGKMPRYLRNAIPHSRVHRKKYYRWLERLIGLDTIKDLADLKRVLKDVETRLQNGSIRKRIMGPEK